MADTVNYIGEKPKGGLRKKVLVGAVVVAIGTVSYISYNHYIAQQEETIGQKLVELYDRGIENKLNEFLDKRPDIANKLIRDSLSSFDRSKAKIEPETYIAMFDEIKEKAEENPEIMNHFGPKALKYAETRIIRGYGEKIETALKDGREKLYETVESIKDNEKIKNIYENIVEGIKIMFRELKNLGNSPNENK